MGFPVLILCIHVSYFALRIFAGFFPRFSEGFGFDAERIGHAVDIVEKADDLGRVVDALIVEAVPAQTVYILRRCSPRIQAELFREGAQCAVGGGQVSPAPVRGQLMDQPVGLVVVLNSKIAGDLGTEVVGVRAYSVHAVIRG